MCELCDNRVAIMANDLETFLGRIGTRIDLSKYIDDITDEEIRLLQAISDLLNRHRK